MRNTVELGVLILSNLVFLVILYFFFSIRLGKALEKSRKSGIPREFYENIELVIQYLDTTLESVTQKNDAFYKLLIRSENLKKELEGLLERFEKTSRRRGKKESPGTPDKDFGRPGVGQHSSRSVEAPTSEGRDHPRLDGALERLFRNAGEDRVEWTRSDRKLPELIGARVDRAAPMEKTFSGGSPRPPASGLENGVPRIFGMIGRFTRKLMGGEESPVLSSDLEVQPDRRTTGSAPKEGESFEDHLYGYSPSTGKSTRWPYPTRQVVEGEASELKETEGLRGGGSANQGIGDAPEEAYFPEGIPRDAASVRDTPASAFVETADLPEVPDLSRAGDRAAFVRTLLRRGMGLEEIGAATGISHQEIEFIQKVMENIDNSSNRRRGRRNG